MLEWSLLFTDVNCETLRYQKKCTCLEVTFVFHILELLALFGIHFQTLSCVKIVRLWLVLLYCCILTHICIVLYVVYLQQVFPHLPVEACVFPGRKCHFQLHRNIKSKKQNILLWNLWEQMPSHNRLCKCLWAIWFPWWLKRPLPLKHLHSFQRGVEQQTRSIGE